MLGIEMVKVVFISRTGDARTANVRDLKLATLHKKCKFRSSAHFGKRATWKHGDRFVTLFAKDSGSAGTENKCDMPPPVDSSLFFGTMLLCAHEGSELEDGGGADFTKEAWSQLYDKLFGGFDDLGEEEEEEAEESIPAGMATKGGYSKESGFVVDDSDSVSVGSASTDESEFSAKETDDSDASDVDEEEEEKDYGESSIESDAGASDGDEEEEEEIAASDDGVDADAGSELVEEEYSYPEN